MRPSTQRLNSCAGLTRRKLQFCVVLLAATPWQELGSSGAHPSSQQSLLCTIGDKVWVAVGLKPDLDHAYCKAQVWALLGLSSSSWVFHRSQWSKAKLVLKKGRKYSCRLQASKRSRWQPELRKCRCPSLSWEEGIWERITTPRELKKDFLQLTTDQKKAHGEGLPRPWSWKKIFFS